MVHSMHERKIEMASRSVGFAGLPGGLGTFEEVLSLSSLDYIHSHSLSRTDPRGGNMDATWDSSQTSVVSIQLSPFFF